MSRVHLDNNKVLLYTLHMDKFIAPLEAQKRRLDSYRPLPPALVANLEDWFAIELTYTSNAIEGNTLSRAETAMVVEKGLTVAGKTIREHLEAINHAEALEWIKRLVSKKPAAITEHDILEIHRLILQKIDDTNASRYRTVSVQIAGSTVVMPNSAKIPQLMADFMQWLHTTNDHPVQIAAEAHYKLVSIHPFVDGNGRTARLLMNVILLQHGYPPAIIKKENRSSYIAALERGQLQGKLKNYYQVIADALHYSLTIYLDAIEEKQEIKDLEKKQLLKIGELARLTDETVPTIRYWTNEGLLEVADYTDSGYQLYDPAMVNRVKKIRKLQKVKRFTIEEIGKMLK